MKYERNFSLNLVRFSEYVAREIYECPFYRFLLRIIDNNLVSEISHSTQETGSGSGISIIISLWIPQENSSRIPQDAVHKLYVGFIGHHGLLSIQKYCFFMGRRLWSDPFTPI